MRIMEPVLPREMETAIPLEEALAMAAAYEEPVYGYAFAGGSAAGHQLEKTEYKACIFTNCRFTGAALSGAWFQNAVFENCDLSGAKLLEATLQKVRIIACSSRSSESARPESGRPVEPVWCAGGSGRLGSGRQQAGGHRVGQRTQSKRGHHAASFCCRLSGS